RAEIVRKMTYSGDQAFRLYDTYGLPLDFIRDAARDAGLPFDEAGFEKAMEEQRAKARAWCKGADRVAARPAYQQIASVFRTEPDFYYGTCAKDCRIEAIVKGGMSVSQIETGEFGEVVLDRTAIYAESGGQIYDLGAFYDATQTQLLADVT